MSRITVCLFVIIMFAAFLCVVAHAQEKSELKETEKNIAGIEKALSELAKKSRLTTPERKMNSALKRSLARLKDMKKNLEETISDLERLNQQARTLLNQYGGITIDAAEDAIEKKDYAKAADILGQILKNQPGNKRAKALLDDILPKLSSGAYGGRAAKLAIAAEGGSPGTESAVLAALRWLHFHQDKDGRWDQDGFQKNCDTRKSPACDGQGTSQYDVAVSGLALLAFLANGHTQQSGTYKETVKKGLDWLVKQQQGDGSLGARLAESWVYNHAIGTAALCESYAMTKDPTLKDPCRKAVDFTCNAQNPGLGWKYEPQDGRNDTSVTGWVVMALKAAKNAGLNVPQSAFDGAINWFDRATNTSGKCGYMRPGDDGSVIRNINERFAKLPTMTAVAVTARIFCGQTRQDPKILKGIDILTANLPEWNKPKNDKVDPYYWYYATQALFQYGGQKWHKWNTAVKKALLDNQRVGQCADGSWDPVGKWDMVGGRVSSTALNCLTLEVYYRYARQK